MADIDHSRLSSFASHTADDEHAFTLLVGSTRHFERGELVRHEGDPTPDVYRLREGWLACSIATAEGGRQITKVHLPGDLVGMPSLAASEAAETIVALTNAVVEVIPHAAFARIAREYPRFMMMLFMWSQEERIRLMHQLTLVGRLRSERRMAAFLLTIYDRLLLNRSDAGLRFALPMTQEDLGDATGLSIVHTNRTIKALRLRELVSVQDGVVTILDLKALRQFASMPTIPRRTTSWI